MSRSYFIDASIALSFDQLHIRILLEKGRDLGFTYLDYKDYCDYLAAIKDYLTIDKAIEKVLKTAKNHQALDDDTPTGLAIAYQETYFILTVSPDDHGVKIVLMPLLYDWIVVYNNVEYFDYGRYIKLLVDLCDGLPFARLSTRTDWE